MVKTHSILGWTHNIFPPTAIRTRTGFIFFFGISALILITLTVSFWINNQITQDTAKITLLNDLRGNLDEPDALSSSVLEGDIRLLLDGGELSRPNNSPLNLDVEKDPASAVALQHVLSSLETWRMSNDDPFAIQALQTALDDAVRLIQLRRADSLGMARGLYAALFISTTCFLLIGLWFTEELIARPLEELVRINYRIAAGDLDTPITLRESNDFTELAESFEAMRLELRQSREQLARRAAELEARVARRTRQFAALSQVVSAASHSHELQEVLRTALEQYLQVLGLETGGLWLVDEASGDLHLAVARGMSESMREQVQIIRRGEGATGQAALIGQTLVLNDLADVGTQVHVKAAARQEGLRSLVAIPITIHEKVVGVLDVMTHQPHTFTAEEITFLTSIGQQIGIGVENARLVQEIRQQTEQVAALQERTWIGAELHDGLLQTLGYLHLQADQLETQALAHDLPDMAQQLARQCDVLERASFEIRRFISDLREMPPSFTLLETALQKMVAQFTQEMPLDISLVMNGLWPRLKANHAEHLVGIAREALLNAVRHGEARQVTLTCTVEGAQGELRVQDDGLGFNTEQLPSDRREHFGLSIMRTRAERLDGQLSIRSAPGQGTCVTVTWPLDKED